MRAVFITLLLLRLSPALQAQELPAAAASGRPLVTHIPSFDAAAYAFGGQLYVYVSHDTDARQAGRDSRAAQDLQHYHLLRLDSASAPARDLGALTSKTTSSLQGAGPAAAAEAGGHYYFYFPVRDGAGLRRIAVAQSNAPDGPFRLAAKAVHDGEGTDPAVFSDADGRRYLYFTGQQGLMIARLHAGMSSFAEAPERVVINDTTGAPLQAADQSRRFAGGAWVHKYRDRYYLSYSTGNSHRLVYATSRNPYGPFTYRGVLLPPVAGWTTRASIVSFRERWYLFYHECATSGGKPFRSVKMTEIRHDPQGWMWVMGHRS